MKNKSLVKKNILGIDITDASLKEVSEYIIANVSKSHKRRMVVTPNPEMIVHAAAHDDVRKVLNKADIAVCDGVGLYIAAWLLGSPLKERITGVDLMLKLCNYASEVGLSIGLLGGRPGVAEKAAKCLQKKVKNIKICFTGSDWDVKKFPKDGVDLLFVAYGFPKQEQWIAKNLPILPIGMAMGVGGAFDYLSGDIKRAPFFVRTLGLEWLFRLTKEPWRYKRQLKLIIFLGMVAKAFFSPSRLLSGDRV